MNPRFDLFARRPFLIYPYTARTNLTDRRANRAWRTLELENEYLKLVVLPDLGGRIYSCVDKATGAEMFYANPSIKYADVAYRGAWVALGVEFNFPVSHNWATVSPVDFGDGPPRGRQRVRLGRQHRPPVRDAVAGRAHAAARPLAPRADDDALQPQRRAPPLLLVDDGLGPRRRRLAHPLPDGVLGLALLRRRRHLAGGLLGRRPQLPAQPRRGLRVALRPRQPRAVHGRLPPRDGVGDGARRRSTTTCRARRSGPGAGTTRARTGGGRSRTTRAPTSRSRPASSGTRRPTRSSSPSSCCGSARPTSRCGRSAATPARTTRASCTCGGARAARCGSAST